jgi:hypothetical protein
MPFVYYSATAGAVKAGSAEAATSAGTVGMGSGGSGSDPSLFKINILRTNSFMRRFPRKAATAAGGWEK